MKGTNIYYDDIKTVEQNTRFTNKFTQIFLFVNLIIKQDKQLKKKNGIRFIKVQEVPGLNGYNITGP